MIFFVFVIEPKQFFTSIRKFEIITIAYLKLKIKQILKIRDRKKQKMIDQQNIGKEVIENRKAVDENTEKEESDKVTNIHQE